MEAAEKIDGRFAIWTPEGVELRMDAAGPGPRLMAWLVDSVIRWTATVVLLSALALAGALGIGLALIVLFLSEWFYPVAFELWRNGVTPGKRVCGLRVVHADGSRVGAAASVLRNLLRFADFLPLLPVLGLVSMAATRRFQRLGDLAAGTVVIHRHAPPGRADPADAPPRVPPFPLDSDEEVTIVEFARRQRQWSDARGLEIASRTVGILGDDPRSCRDRVLSIASWLVGHRRTEGAP